MQLAFDIISPARRAATDNYGSLSASLAPLGEAMREVRKGYSAILQSRKTPSLQVEYKRPVADGEKVFSAALRSVEHALKPNIAADKRAGSRALDAMGSLWSTFGRYSSEAGRFDANVVTLASLLEQMGEWIAELNRHASLAE